tara:strand:- start:16774 stop:17274 length:501 start_codon:yes stop_codon:yes gene_type:complete
MSHSIRNHNSHADSGNRYLCFSLGKEKFAIPLLQVKEVIANTATTTIPQAPAYFKGIMNLRGQVISVIDLRSKLKIAHAETSLETTIVILDINGLSLGVIVDSVDAVLAYSADSISDPPDHDNSMKADYIVGVAREKDHLTLILDLKRALNTDDMKSLRLQQKATA